MNESSPHTGDRVNDETLALAVTHGDTRAFRALYLRHYPCVLTYVTRFLGTGPDCEDVIQDVFLQLYRALPSFRGAASFSTFLRRITMNVAVDHLRKRGRLQRLDYDSDALDEVVDAGQDPERHSSARQQLQSLLHRLDDIALDQRRALLLAEQVLALISLSGVKNPYYDRENMLTFGRGYLGWKTRVALNKLQRKRYQQNGTFRERGQAAPDLAGGQA